MIFRGIKKAQQQRLAYIDCCLEYFGEVNRQDVAEYFGIGVTSCTRDFMRYRELAPKNLSLRHTDKHYVRTNVFAPLFKHTLQTTLVDVSEGFESIIPSVTFPEKISTELITLRPHQHSTFAGLTRAIFEAGTVHIILQDLNDGEVSGAFTPHSLFCLDTSWYVRGYCHTQQMFKSLPIYAIDKMQRGNTLAGRIERSEGDIEWNSTREITIRVSSDAKNKRAIQLKYGILDNSHRINVRLAMLDQILEHLNIDAESGKSMQRAELEVLIRNP